MNISPEHPQSSTNDDRSGYQAIPNKSRSNEVLSSVPWRLLFNIFVNGFHPKGKGWRSVHDHVYQKNLNILKKIKNYKKKYEILFLSQFYYYNQ